MSIYNKIKWVLGISMVFVLIITTNLIDRNNFLRVRDSVVTIYEDRLVAKNIIFELAKSVHEKEMALAINDAEFFKQRNANVNTYIRSLITSFEQTKLTKEESQIFNDLKQNFESLSNAEETFVQSSFSEKSTLAIQLSSIKENLDDLSAIQLNEAGRQMTISQRAIDTVELYTQIEIYLLVFLAILIQIIVMYNPKERD